LIDWCLNPTLAVFQLCCGVEIQIEFNTFDEVYLIQHYVIKLVSELQQVGGFCLEVWYHPPIKLTAMI
jgi:hypothetical protein